MGFTLSPCFSNELLGIIEDTLVIQNVMRGLFSSLLNIFVFLCFCQIFDSCFTYSEDSFFLSFVFSASLARVQNLANVFFYIYAICVSMPLSVCVCMAVCKCIIITQRQNPLTIRYTKKQITFKKRVYIIPYHFITQNYETVCLCVCMYVNDFTFAF